jgi:hypothetical protein
LLRDIPDRGDYADALLQMFTRRDARTPRDTLDVVRCARSVLALALVIARCGHRLDALAYPTLCRSRRSASCRER